jgi:hypothetical protein
VAQLLVSPWTQYFDDLVRTAKDSLVICSPYVGQAPCERVMDILLGRSDGRPPATYLLTDLSVDNMLSGVTDVAAILELARSIPQITIRFLPSLHAKVYVADTARAVITSANLTEAGLRRNFEYGVLLDDTCQVTRVREDVLRYGDLGSPVGPSDLGVFAGIVADLRDIRRQAERDTKRQMRREFDRRLRQASDEVLRVRAAGRAPTTIFADAILHLVRDVPMSTKLIHMGIKHIHPDLCDDTIDRVIDGEHFGKKWKHAVRTAQQHLKKRGLITYEDGLWSVAPNAAASGHL